MLEAVVYSHRAAELLPTELARPRPETRSEQTLETTVADAAQYGAWKQWREQLRDLMWDNAGIVRTDERLERADQELAEMRARIDREYLATTPVPELIELRNLVDCAVLIVRCARQRRESRGLHYNIDYPYRDNEHYLRDTRVLNV